MKNISNNRRQNGATLVFVAITIVVFLGVAALAVDIGYQKVVRNELQNAADATALAACNKFYSRDPVVFSDPDSLEPLWNEAIQEANNSIGMNESVNQTLQDLSSLVGWWDITKAYSPDQWTISSPSTNYPPPTSNYGPAIRVTVAKASGQNSGPISNFFGGILGVFTSDVNATSTAVAASPGSVRPQSLIPVAVTKALADRSTDFDNEDDLMIMGSPYFYGDDLAGQWTSFHLDANDTTTVRGLIDDGNPTALSIGDPIWIEPGVKDTLYDNTNQPSIEKDYAGEDVVIPIIDVQDLADNTHAEFPIVGFIGFHIICAGKGCNGMTLDDPNNPTNTITMGNNEKVIIGYFTTAPAYGGGPVGPHYGPLDRCRLCR